MPGHATITERPRFPRTAQPSQVQPPEARPAYYDVSMLKPPVWEKPIGVYFFLGGLAAGAYLLARVAERAGGERMRPITRAGSAVALLGALPCAPLLIEDLGDPKRFHHMLRVFKPESPMNLGAWALTAFSGAAALAVLREWMRGDIGEEKRSRAAQATDAVVLAVLDGAGVPAALVMTCYTGVLLSCTATPVWSKNPWLAPLFGASAMNTAASAIQLVLSGFGYRPDGPEQRSLEKIALAGHVAEAAAVGAYLTCAGSLARLLTHGKEASTFWCSLAGMAASEFLTHLGGRSKLARAGRFAGSLLNLASGLGLRLALLSAGSPSANDPDAARQASRAR